MAAERLKCRYGSVCPAGEIREPHSLSGCEIQIFLARGVGGMDGDRLFLFFFFPL